MIETRKREMSQQARLEEEPPRKIRRIVPERIGKIIDVTGDDDPDAPVIIKITPGVDPYAQLDLEEEELEYKVRDETASEIHPDDADAEMIYLASPLTALSILTTTRSKKFGQEWRN